MTQPTMLWSFENDDISRTLSGSQRSLSSCPTVAPFSCRRRHLEGSGFPLLRQASGLFGFGGLPLKPSLQRVRGEKPHFCLFLTRLPPSLNIPPLSGNMDACVVHSFGRQTHLPD